MNRGSYWTMCWFSQFYNFNCFYDAGIWGWKECQGRHGMEKVCYIQNGGNRIGGVGMGNWMYGRKEDTWAPHRLDLSENHDFDQIS